jgi:hypothetical protein
LLHTPTRLSVDLSECSFKDRCDLHRQQSNGRL